MKFYASKTHDILNGVPFNPEDVIDTICLNPKYPTRVKWSRNTDWIMDSGAFQDVSSDKRLTFGEALNRQLDYIKTFPPNVITNGRIVSYDRLVDEQFNATFGQFKQRVSETVGEEYVEETIRAAEYLDSKRGKLDQGLILSCQGATVPQYVDCADKIIDIAHGSDTIGIGGFCILSKSQTYERDYYSVIRAVFPKMAVHGIKKAHIFGMGVFRVLLQTDLFARRYGIDVSYDTSSAEVNATMGRVFDPMNMQLVNVFGKEHKKLGYEPAEVALLNIGAIHDFWERAGKLSTHADFKPGMKQKQTKLCAGQKLLLNEEVV